MTLYTLYKLISYPKSLETTLIDSIYMAQNVLTVSLSFYFAYLFRMLVFVRLVKGIHLEKALSLEERGTYV